ncbi:MAG: hypothetical protein AABN34_16485 [Acidobacteriota bacterium]
MLEGKLDKLDAEREEALAKIEELKRDIRSLAQLAGESEDIALGLTEACKEIFLRTESFLSPTEIRQRLADLGFPIEEHKHALASISTTLRRLLAADVIESVKTQDGSLRWRRKVAFPKVRAK